MTTSNTESTAPPLVRVRNLRIGFGKGADATAVVHGVDLDLHAGECLAVVGESGSGKSVTARSLIGLSGDGAKISADELTVKGSNVLKFSQSQWRKLRGADVGYVLQDALVSLDPLRTIGREIEDALRLHTRQPASERRAHVLQLLADVGIPEPGQRINQRSGDLSGGLRQRALIASAVALKPAVLVADEPTTALDATVQKQILSLLLSLKEQGTGLLLISHDLAVVGSVADRIAVMRQGEIVETGIASQILENPQHEYTKRLLKAVPTGRPRGERLSSDPIVISERQHKVVESHRENAEPRDASQPFLVASNLRKTYSNPDGSERVAVDDVSFALNPGSTLGIVGESGSGKSTVARIVLGLTEADSGSVSLFGQDWSSLAENERRPRRRHLASIYQDPLGSFDPRLNVSDILSDAIPANVNVSKSDRAEQVIELLRAVGLNETVARRNPLRLSGGQRQRIAIARTLASGPDIIICDEPVSALDVSIQAQVLDLLDALQQEFGLSYVFISHDLGVVQHVSDEILVMNKGRVIEAGRAEEIFNNPKQEYTKSLLAAAPRLATTAGGAL